jgi:NAD(P)-dependent dehydrogenase (short-subunit alcohol dehydrogenase family)
MSTDPLFAPFRLDGRRALVTGASSGFGRHFALVLAQAGAEVLVAARRADRLAGLVAEIEKAGGKARAFDLDVTKGDSIRACFAASGPVHVVVNNAGMSVNKRILEYTEADWDLVDGTNLRGAWLVAQEAAKGMAAAGIHGSIINITSILGSRVQGGLTLYAASKAGLKHLTRSMALELAKHGIRVNSIAPGYVSTEINGDYLASEAGDKMRKTIPFRRFGDFKDLTGPLLLLASDAGAYMTGSEIVVDGGHLCSAL